METTLSIITGILSVIVLQFLCIFVKWEYDGENSVRIYKSKARERSQYFFLDNNPLNTAGKIPDTASSLIPYKPSVIFKCLASFIPAILCALFINSLPDILILIALATCCLADGALEYNFPAGTLIFLSAHLLLIVSFILTAGIKTVTIISFAALLIISVTAVFIRFRKEKAVSRIIFCLYAAVISAMLSSSFSLLQLIMSGNESYIFAVSGAMLFFLSDFILAMTVFRKSFPALDFLILTPYYSALCLLAMSVVFR